MRLIEIFFGVFFILFLIRLLVADTGQMAFNRTYQMVVRLTRPILAILSRLFPARLRPAAPLFALLIIVVLQGVIYAGGGRPETRLETGVETWVFNHRHSGWGVAKSLTVYLIFTYKFYAFLLLVAIFSPLMDSSDQVSRLVRPVLRPLYRLGRSGGGSLVLLFVLFTLILTLLIVFYQGEGMIVAGGEPVLRAAVLAAAFIVSLLSVFLILIIARVILSWLSPLGASGPVGMPLMVLTDPWLRPFSKLGARVGNFDFTPLLAVFFIVILRRVCEYLLGGLHRMLAAG